MLMHHRHIRMHYHRKTSIGKHLRARIRTEIREHEFVNTFMQHCKKNSWIRASNIVRKKKSPRGAFVWSRWREVRGSNPRPPTWQAGALTSWANSPFRLQRRLFYRTFEINARRIFQNVWISINTGKIVSPRNDAERCALRERVVLCDVQSALLCR